jgi:hypothetical protein
MLMLYNYQLTVMTKSYVPNPLKTNGLGHA